MTYSKEDILDKTKQLAKMIAETEEVEFFKTAEEQLNENKKVSEMMKAMKHLQKEAVNLQQLGKSEALALTESKIVEVQTSLNEMPIVQEFMQSQGEVNELLQMVTNVISNTLTDEICESTGGNKLSGETGSKIKNSTCGGK